MQMRKKAFILSAIYVLVFPHLIIYLFQSIDMKWNCGVLQENVQENAYTAISVINGDCVTVMDFDDYLACVLQGEMPATFFPEALKAQAVATRTYTLRKISKGGKHPEGVICTDVNCCQAFSEFPDEVFADAVKQTKNQVLMFNDVLIDATYFSCSGGMTEAAVEVWGTDVPYLQSVVSPGEESSRYFRDTVCFTKEQFLTKLGLDPERIDLPIIGDITYTAGNGVKTIVILDTNFTGNIIRELLGLRSTSFEISNIENSIVITTSGYGHRVGMSQYGADAMARAGSTYKEILAYYYPGTELQLFTEEDW